MKPLGETSSILLSVVLPCDYTSILFVLHKCRKFFFFADFGAAILVFSARFGAASCCCNFAFCSTTYVRPLSHLSLLALVTFVFFTLRCHLFFIFRCHLFFFMNPSAFSHSLSFLLHDKSQESIKKKRWQRSMKNRWQRSVKNTNVTKASRERWESGRT